MSTFDGIVKEFPTIQIDYFWKHKDKHTAAYFLSHVHSDHLMGLESVRSAFVYCSATTANMLLNMEKYPHRINLAKGILERRIQTYRHLKSVLRILPLQTPTELELSPKSTIRVTLFDANHCPGAVMFLIEGNDRAILYTGDVRAEPWWVNSIGQSPSLLPYSAGVKILDCLYLDTTFATHEEPYRDFPTKADGLKELMLKVSICPPDSLFYFRAWTLGYENVWIVLSDLLQSKIHVDEYACRLLSDKSCRGDSGFSEGPSLTGYQLGNVWHQGCLSQDNATRIHSCEPGLPCHRELSRKKNVIWITPIISRLNDGTEVGELGAGGGWGDLHSKSGLNLDSGISLDQIKAFMQLHLDNKEQMTVVEEALAQAWKLRNFTLFLQGLENVLTGDELVLPLKEMKEALMGFGKQAGGPPAPTKTGTLSGTNTTIHFPYSRHSSYNELRDLVGKFRPKDICPCTVDESSWCEDLSMEALFGDLCSDKTFFYDESIRRRAEEVQALASSTGNKKRKRDLGDSQETVSKMSSDEDVEYISAVTEAERETDSKKDRDKPSTQPSLTTGQSDVNSLPGYVVEISKVQSAFRRINSNSDVIIIEDDSEEDCSVDTSVFDGEAEDNRKSARIGAYKAAKQCLKGQDDSEWNWYPLRSAGRSHDDQDELEL
ncbi:hypothetical protein PV10_00679 [Exophiala mesophila]|uniref:Protein artemis n=1 Tax=Exophiala mesophila TaxID=212818 RepID=A0A0D1ZSH1_EXOME|nr:uncharacterized protein PV10_00679 [Exophiala mesophila]KIV96864.1 hypothetical protein PV10_00679 [Exophiala mesophila]